ncbi:hypothetical protein [Streptomyces sp. B1I3]|uniref:hypothetical protein n=1 Tax=Streptomyces sp. B1I3 TaxID=3042264 RepID=UPI0027871458|nr:hypothetical protein [Streptomyces sp. B1I3]MDQ0796733.1 hypothetical protein [Streptomyces sp. B1I3]
MSTGRPLRTRERVFVRTAIAFRPAPLPRLRLAEDTETACTADHRRRTPVVKGAARAVAGLVVATGLG